jgi:formylglycine-generating enzyme required for sulfatase activity
MRYFHSLFALFLFFILNTNCQQDRNIWRNKVDDSKYVRIPAGEIEVRIKNTVGEDSLSTVTFDNDFWLAVTEVSVKQFSQFVDKTGYQTKAEREENKFTWKAPGFEQDDTHPVVWLAYEDAVAYAEWAQVSIPTETEWLYACRAGTETKFFWGDSLDDSYLWHRQNTQGTGTRPVGTKTPNPWGLYNMVGNAREYVFVCDSTNEVRGSSWTRCPSYVDRRGKTAKGIIAGKLDTRLTECGKARYSGYPYDDDRGFRCVKRREK